MDHTRTVQDKARKDFYWHLSVFIVINSGLAILNLVTSDDTIWFIWPLLGWGIGLVFHALSTFVFRDWEDTGNDDQTP